MKKFKNNRAKGITLIALVITIIVLLILAGISISMLSSDNSILKNASVAKESTLSSSDMEIIKLAVLASYGKDGSIDTNKLAKHLKSIDGLTDTKNNNIIETNINLPKAVKINGHIYCIDEDGTVKEAADRSGIKVGDYVNYRPDVPTGTKYPKDRLVTYSGSTNNKNDIKQDALNWKVLRIYDDGSLDIIGDATSQDIFLNGIKGYTNGVYLMNEICRTLYSREGIEARSVNLGDFEYWISQSSEGISARNAYSGYNQEKTYTSENKYPTFYKTQKNESDSGTLMEDCTYTSDGDLTVKQTAYYLPMKYKNYGDGSLVLSSSEGCWIATRHVNCFYNYAGFSLFLSGSDGGSVTMLGSQLFESKGKEYLGFRKLRPVVHLSSKVKIISHEGTSINEMHEITSY